MVNFYKKNNLDVEGNRLQHVNFISKHTNFSHNFNFSMPICFSRMETNLKRLEISTSLPIPAPIPPQKARKMKFFNDFNDKQEIVEEIWRNLFLFWSLNRTKMRFFIISFSNNASIFDLIFNFDFNFSISFKFNARTDHFINFDSEFDLRVDLPTNHIYTLKNSISIRIFVKINKNLHCLQKIHIGGKIPITAHSPSRSRSVIRSVKKKLCQFKKLEKPSSRNIKSSPIEFQTCKITQHVCEKEWEYDVDGGRNSS